MDTLPQEMKDIIITKASEINIESFKIEYPSGYASRFEKDMVKDPVNYIRVVEKNIEGEEKFWVFRTVEKVELFYDMIMNGVDESTHHVKLEYGQGGHTFDTNMFNEYEEFADDLKEKTIKWVSAMME